MGNCSGKLSKRDKKLEREEVYKPSNNDTDNQEEKHDNKLVQEKNGSQSSKSTTSMVKDSDISEIKDKNMKNNIENKNIPEKVSDKREQTIEITSKTDSVISSPAINVNNNRSHTSNNGTNDQGMNVEKGEKDDIKSVDSTELKITQVIKQTDSKTVLQKTNMAVDEAVQEVQYDDSTNRHKTQATANTAEASTPGEKEGKLYLFAKGHDAPEQEESEFIDKKAPVNVSQPEDTTDNYSNITRDVPVIKQQTKDENLSSQPNNFVTGGMKSASDDPKERQNEENKISEIISNTTERTGHTNKQTRTGYVAAKFSKPEKQGKEYVAAGNSQHVKGKKTKTQKKKDPWDPPSDFKGNVIHYVDVLNIGNDTVIINKGSEKPEEDDEEFEQRYTISVRTMDILKEVSKSVGYIHGLKESGTCWRAGNNKIVTAAHVVKGNIWSSVGKFYNEAELNNIYVNFDYIERSAEKYQTGSIRFKVEPRVIHLDESLDVAVLQLKHDEHHELPKALQMFHKLDPKKDLDKEIFLISHNKGESKGINGKIGIWTPTEKGMAELQTFCQKYGQDNGYLELDRSDRLVIKCDFVGGASGSPGITLLNDTPHVVLIYLRGFPDFYYMTNFSQVKKKKFPQSKLFQQGTCIGSFYDKLSCNLPLRNEIFPLEAELETNNKRHQYAMAGDSSKKSLQISTCSEAHNITAVTNSSYIDSHAGDLLNDPAVVHHTTMRQASCIFLTDTVYDSSNAVENLSFNQNVHSRNIGEHDQPLVKGEDDVGPMKNLGTTRLQDFISPDEFTS